MGAMQTMWHATADGWNERTSTIRQNYAVASAGGAPALAAGNDGISVWAKGYIGGFRRESDQSFGGATLDTGYHQSVGGMQIGGDYSFRYDSNIAFTVGALLGYNKSSVEYTADANKADMGIWNVGLYATYLNGPYFADLLIKEDITRINLDLPAFQ